MSARLTTPVLPLTWGRNNLPVPYATAWSEETASVGNALTTQPSGIGLAYRDETPADRDRHGVLWARMTEAPGEGRPDFSSLHANRQRRSMFEMLCQVCGGPASRTPRGVLFLLPRPAGGEASHDWAEGALSTKPPLCEPCADLATRHCPHLADPLFVRSRKPRIWGVFGGIFTPTANGLLPSPSSDYLPYGHPAASWFLASQLVIELTRCRVVG
ncbi:hypothetical protein FH609_005365 [Streptomyces sp. 3MP-14]|uniref:Uncharacterized protein n=1 Tax=Streptomyces mimosae TaxID=2586635 RepID=A0A5N6ANT8_9ACTN|nr:MULTISPECIES: hypothetical protein [Streptomyces]KAB8169726.1 hypothetical protein FH607_003045 [Streptomyces mimosae]KAB8178474.1 hypothetical protein FH609_005365 [Streptomyces sp. 3MP-14]